MKVSGAAANVIFSGKVGGSRVWLCNVDEGAVLHHLGGEQRRQSCCPLAYAHGGQQPPWLPTGAFPKVEKRETSLNWALCLGGKRSFLVTMGARLRSQSGR